MFVVLNQWTFLYHKFVQYWSNLSLLREAQPSGPAAIDLHDVVAYCHRNNSTDSFRGELFNKLSYQFMNVHY